MSNNPTTGKKTSTAPSIAATKKTETKKTPPARETPRVVIQDRLMLVLSKHPNGATLEEVESEGQKLKALPKGRYSGVARSEFQTKKDKDGEVTVYPAISDHGFLVSIKHTVDRGSIHWGVRTFPKQAAEAAERLEKAKKLTSKEVADFLAKMKEGGK